MPKSRCRCRCRGSSTPAIGGDSAECASDRSGSVRGDPGGDDSGKGWRAFMTATPWGKERRQLAPAARARRVPSVIQPSAWPPPVTRRSEEHTSELQSPMRISYAVFCLKTKNNLKTHKHKNTNTQAKLE